MAGTEGRTARGQGAATLPLWDLLAPEGGELRPLDGPAEADLAVIGGGLVGLAVALEAARGGARVIVLERGRLAAGASGRTTGFVAPALRPLPGGQSLEAALGPARAAAFRALVAGSGAALFRLIAETGMAVPQSRGGWIAAAHVPGALARLAAQAGPQDTVLDAAGLAALTGIAGWHGGVCHAGSGAIDPLAYVRALAQAVTAAGGRVCTESGVDAIRAEGRGLVLECGPHRVAARHAVLATNALSGGLWPALSRALMPVTVWQVASAPLPEALFAEILPQDHVVTDTRRNSIALRWTPDRRLLTGGIAGPSLRPARTAAGGFFARRVARLAAPALARAGLPADLLAPERLGADLVWSGRIALTGTGLPLLADLAPGLTALVACNGRGIALGTALGRALGTCLAEAVAAHRDRPDFAALPVPLVRPKRQWLAPLAGLGARLRVPLAEHFDRRDLGGGAA